MVGGMGYQTTADENQNRFWNGDRHRYKQSNSDRTLNLTKPCRRQGDLHSLITILQPAYSANQRPFPSCPTITKSWLRSSLLIGATGPYLLDAGGAGLLDGMFEATGGPVSLLGPSEASDPAEVAIGGAGLLV